MTFGKVLRQLRKEFGLTQKSLSRHLGIAESTIGMYEREQREPDFETLEAIADYFNVDMDYLTGRSNIRKSGNFHALPNLGYATSSYLVDCLLQNPPDKDVIAPLLQYYNIPNVIPLPKMKKIPLLGTISCGEPILADENIEGFLAMPENVGADFCLRCKGDSMINARIFDGDIVYIRQQPQVEDGEIAAVMVGDEEATLKRVRLFPDHIVLEPENPQYRAKSFWDADMDNVRILGKAVAFTSNIR